jgi:hypothetical protein
VSKWYLGGNTGWTLRSFSDGTFAFHGEAGTNGTIGVRSTTDYADNTWHYAAGRRLSYDGYLDIDDSDHLSTTTAQNGSIGGGSVDLAIGARTDLSHNDDSHTNGTIDEVRVTNGFRSDAWIKASCYSIKDELISYNAGYPIFYFTGYVHSEGSPAARTVYLYRRSNGNLVGTTVSDASTGYFSIPSTYSEYHFVNILPEIGDGYNLISKDQIHPDN